MSTTVIKNEAIREASSELMHDRIMDAIELKNNLFEKFNDGEGFNAMSDDEKQALSIFIKRNMEAMKYIFKDHIAHCDDCPECESDVSCKSKTLDDFIGFINIWHDIIRLGISPEAFTVPILTMLTDEGTFEHTEDFNAFSFMGYMPAPVKIIVNEPDTVVLFSDGSKSVVHCESDTKFDAEKGIYLAFLKKALGGSDNLQAPFTLMENAGLVTSKIDTTDNAVEEAPAKEAASAEEREKD